jgi:nucleotide-binding universal stress UspA family protein
MRARRPIVVALPFDHETQDILRSAEELAKALDAPLLPVHAVRPWILERRKELAARQAVDREEIVREMASILNAGIEVLEPRIPRGRAADLVVEAAVEENAQMVITGGGGPATVQRFLFGSVAERIVRTSPVPVYVARGPFPHEQMTILCPVDLSAQARVGFLLALRVARLFKGRIDVLTVIPGEAEGFVIDTEDLEAELSRNEAKAREQIETFLNAHDLSGVDVTPRVVVGRAPQRIVEASSDADLLVLGSRGFDMLRPFHLGGVTERALRFSRCSALTVRDRDSERDHREAGIRQVAELRTRAARLMADGDAASALPLFELALSRATTNAALHDAYADALEAVGRSEDAIKERDVASLIRESFG